MPKITISVEYDNTEDAIIGLSLLRGGDNTVGAARIPVTDKTKKDKGADPKPDSAVKTDTPAASSPAATTAASGAATSGATSSGEISYDSVVAKIKASVEKNRAEVLATLGAFDAKSGKDLKPADYAAFLQKLDAAMAPAGDDLS